MFIYRTTRNFSFIFIILKTILGGYWGIQQNFKDSTVVGENINIMRTTLDFNLDLYLALKQHGYSKTLKQREAVN